MNSEIVDIPRIYTALAEWLACLAVASRLPTRMPRAQRALALVGSLAVQSSFLMLTDDIPISLWIPCMAVAALLMLVLIMTLRNLDLAAGAYSCVRAFVLAEFAASLQWQIRCFFWSGPFGVWWQELGLLLAVYGVVFGGVVLLERRCSPDVQRPSVSWHDLVSVLIMGICIFAISNLSFVYQHTPFSSRHTSDILNIRTIVDFGGVAMLYAYHLQQQQNLARKELAAMQSVLENQYAQYRMSRESIEMINRRYHDLKHQIAALRAEQSQEVRNRWLDEMEEEILDYETQNKTGNSVLDTVLTGKSLFCRRHDIAMTVVADGSALSMMDTMDICSLFGNALDNAIECELKQPDKSKRMIHLSLTVQKQFLFLQVENYCPQTTRFRNGLPVSTKQDAENHGFGTKSIQAVAKKYGGSTVFALQDDWFVLKVLLPLPKE